MRSKETQTSSPKRWATWHLSSTETHYMRMMMKTEQKADHANDIVHGDDILTLTVFCRLKKHGYSAFKSIKGKF